MWMIWLLWGSWRCNLGRFICITVDEGLRNVRLCVYFVTCFFVRFQLRFFLQLIDEIICTNENSSVAIQINIARTGGGGDALLTCASNMMVYPYFD
jgi:hypothetical protein